MKKIRVGLLPLYIKLYDDVDPALRVKQMPFLQDVAAALEAEDLELSVSDVCRVRPEFERAVAGFNAQGVDAVVTLHLAYSPSLEAIDALAALDVPIILMDTTPTYDFIAEAGVPAIDRNHGIHGVQDLCSMLKRRGVKYHLACGHLEHSDIAKRVAGLCRAAAAAKAMRDMRVGLVGEPFDGMGDFRVEQDTLRAVTGATVVQWRPEAAKALMESVGEAEVDAQVSDDLLSFDAALEHPENHRVAALAGLMLRRWAEENALGAMSVNFERVSRAIGLPKMPFVELSRMMAHGVGYAGEGDTLTAALVGALMHAYPDTGFTEMFCPDWKRGVLLLSHMAEMNCALSAEKPLLTDMPFPFNDVGDTVGAFGCLKPGRAVLVNLTPLAGNRFTLIAADVELLVPDWDESQLNNQIRGWMKPDRPLPEFLEWFSAAGGTHHSALVYGADKREIEAFGRMMGFDIVTV